ncbi:MAG TPA: hypothetical protein VES79_11065, partial [Solirubrobacteraceae bacterium]|nr:hypothetical protein [Solirubrobacteraceae bacterium]
MRPLASWTLRLAACVTALLLALAAGSESLDIPSPAGSTRSALGLFGTTAPAPPLIRPGGVAAARRWAASRSGTVAFAVARERRHMRGRLDARAFPSASVSKAMLLVAVLRRARHSALTGGDHALLRK